MQHQGFTSATEALDFIAGGNAVFPIQSEKTGAHFTFKADCPKDKKTGKKDPVQPTRFVKVLADGRNTAWEDQLFVGHFHTGMPGWLKTSRNNPQAADWPSFKALAWALTKLNEARVNGDEIPTGLKVFHEGACCRCNRPLTDPASIQSGIGPECAKKGM